MNSSVTISDLDFLQSWLRAEPLLLTGLEILEMGDPNTAERIRHERECTEAAFRLLPQLLAEARQRLQGSSEAQAPQLSSSVE